MDLGLRGKVALVTGASQGIGLAVCETMLTEGMLVVGTSRTPPPERPGLTHVVLDMSRAEAGTAAVTAVLEAHGRLDVLVNNVGTGLIGTGFASEDDDRWNELLELNLMATVRTTRAALPHLTADGGGVVVNVSSINGHQPETGIYSYSATKAAMNSLTVGLSKEYARQGVRVVGVAPGPVTTPLWLGPNGVAAQASALGAGEPDSIVESAIAGIPVGRFTTAQEVAALITFLASPRAGTITATTVVIDGGLTPTT